ncbi:MAG: tetratricopeptide repeat protein [Gammaproteobacteria bacterium]
MRSPASRSCVAPPYGGKLRYVNALTHWLLLACAVLALTAGADLTATAQALPSASASAPAACVATKKPTNSEPRLAERVAAADRAIKARRPGAWAALAELAHYSCEIMGDRQPADAAFRRCLRECADARDVYFAHVYYALMLERFGDEPGAEQQYLEALQSRDDPQNAYMAYMSYATMLDRRGRPRDALDLLNRFAGDWSYFSPPLQLKLSLMRALGLDAGAEEQAAKLRPATDLVRTRLDSPPLSAIPVEANPMAQNAFGRTIEVVGKAWIEPAAEAGPPKPGLLIYHRASMPNPAAFVRNVALEPGLRFIVVADLGASGCRALVGDARYDLVECPWRSGRADADLFRVVDEKTPLPPPFVLRPRSPSTVGSSPLSEEAPLWSAWETMYRAFADFEQRGQPAYAVSVLEQAGLTSAEAAQVRTAGKEYVRQIERIDADARRQIAERFSPSDPIARALPHSVTDPAPPLGIDGDKLPAGKTLEDVLTEEGFTSRIESQKDALLRAHLDDLSRAIPEKVASLEHHVRENIAPGVRRVTIVGAPAK